MTTERKRHPLPTYYPEVAKAYMNWQARLLAVSRQAIRETRPVEKASLVNLLRLIEEDGEWL